LSGSFSSNDLASCLAVMLLAYQDWAGLRSGRFRAFIQRLALCKCEEIGNRRDLPMYFRTSSKQNKSEVT
jgi:hypothetical protein